MANLPYKFTQKAQDEKDWKKSKTRAGDNYNCMKFNKEAYKANYDEIDWSAKGK
jgi:hypothetical protein